jgi:hypothetical protein
MKFLRFAVNLLSGSRDRRYYALKLLGEMVTGDYRTSWHQLDWWRDPEFNAYLHDFGEFDSFNTHRRWMAAQLIRLTAHVPGDTAECGVYKGSSSWLIAAFAARCPAQPKLHHLFDSFKGLSTPEAVDGEYWAEGDLAASEAEVARNLAPFGEILRFHKGWIPDRFPDVAGRRFSFVHVDVDIYQPTRDSIEFFYDRLNPGAIFLCDDYAFATCPGATKAIDEFLEDRPEKMLLLDAGGGFFIKGTAVEPGTPLPRRDPSEVLLGSADSQEKPRMVL